MDDGVLASGTMLGAQTDSPMDFDYMDELLLEGCWFETTDGFEYLNPSPSSSAAFFDHSFVWPISETNTGDSSFSPSQKSNQEDKTQDRSPVNTRSHGQNAVSVSGWGNSAAEGSDISRRWWIGPRANPGPGTSVRERLIMALGYVKNFTKEKDFLMQIWVPVNRGGRRVLTTHDQPFELDPNCLRLARYRDISVKYQFSAEEDSKDFLGLPGRVFLGKVPEWTPDVRFFRSDEYPRVDHAQQYDVRGTLALPVFEQGSRTCLGVIEVVTTAQKINYHPELESVCKALEAVDLRSSEVPSTQNVKAFDMSYQAALPEIHEVLRSACETHRLPLAQTWVPCIEQGKGGCRHSDENYSRCVSTVDLACYIADPGIRGFHEACSEHHLLKGQGVTGGAFMTNQPCFSTDVTSFGNTEYPLSHHARMFGLRAAVAIRLRSVHTGAVDFVLEFFLPSDCTDPEEQKKMLTSLSIIIQQICQTLRVVTDKELEEEIDLPLSEAVVPSGGGMSREELLRTKQSYSEACTTENSFMTDCLTEVQQSGCAASFCQKEKQNVIFGGDSTFGDGSFSSVFMGKTGEKGRTKAEKTITLQVLQQYFAGSLKNAAKSIGVCPTTLKRICRQHGITRWPSRKIKKVGHSLQKLQLVIDSVQGASSSLQVGSFYANFPELASPNFPRSSPFPTSEPSDHPRPSSIQHEGVIFNSQVFGPKSPSSSCSQSSSSSHCCSSGTQQHPSSFTVAASEDPMRRENSVNGMLKRVGSNAELHVTNQEHKKPLPRSQSHKSLSEQPSMGNLPLLPRSSHLPQQIDAQRVKVTYGNEKIRFRMSGNWGLKDLLQEIVRRFNIDDIRRFDLKYLDDDSEWVLLTCDDDLEECIDVCRSSQAHTIKLALHVSSRSFGGSLARSGPS